MGIVTTLDADNLDYTITMIICEWIADTNCFGNPTNKERLANVEAAIRQLAGELDRPIVSVETVFLRMETTGAGELDGRKEFRHYNTRIQIATSSASLGYAKEIGAIQLGDIMLKHWKHATKGKYALGHAGLRKSRLNGPVPDKDKNYYYQHWFLTFVVEA